MPYKKNGKMKPMDFAALTVVVSHQFEDLPDLIKCLTDNSHHLSKHYFDNSKRYNTLFQKLPLNVLFDTEYVCPIRKNGPLGKILR